MNKGTLVGFATLLMISSLLCYAQQGSNNVVLGAGFEKNQKSEKTLSFTVPSGWSEDTESAKKLGLHKVLVPQGTTLQNADKVISVAFQKKDTSQPGLENLVSFVRVDLQETLAQFPNAQFARWQPSKLDPDKIKFWSIEMFGKEKNQPSPQRLVIIDAGDGYFSITLTANTRSELQVPMYEEFFNSIGVTSE